MYRTLGKRYEGICFYGTRNDVSEGRVCPKDKCYTHPRLFDPEKI